MDQLITRQPALLRKSNLYMERELFRYKKVFVMSLSCQIRLL